MNYVTEDITPAKAQEYLKTSIGNRPISKIFVHSYADTMKKGKWMLNGQPIIFDDGGHLIDGHHRLLGIIEAGIPVRFDVCRGASHDAFTTYDCGRHRTVGQLLAMQDVKNYKLVASIVVANDRLIKTGRLFENNNSLQGGKRNTNTDKYEMFRADPVGFENAGEYIRSLLSRAKVLSGSWAGGLYYYLTHNGGYTEAEVNPFFEAIFSLDSSGINVCDMLRRAITKSLMEGKKMKAELLWALVVKTWNSYITGQEPKILRYQTTEELPKLKVR